ncbi:tricalbin [Polychaeton citri CBS 116435]|uniref:Tricalbin n=1 Tax=Polychaeton citri CBS 116435 TaxID=1314669 RepID=A0A9P4QAD5_9PEZI|nr:tricalbin [Polychaeton citri CBS 116435]
MLEGTAGRASELKQQGVLEAAQDPNSNITAEDAEKAVVNESKKAGAAAFEFDPNASPEEKAAQARAMGGERHHRQHQVAALVSDQDDGKTAGYDLPPPSKAGVVAAPSDAETRGHIAKDDEEAFAKTGWAPRFGNPGDKDAEEEGTMLDHSTFLETKLDDKFFGDWYHNTGIIVFCCLTSWVVGIFGGGLGWIFIIFAFSGTYYRTSIRRVRRNFRDDVNRELAKTRIETDSESLEWMNNFLTKFWPIYAPVLCQTIIASVDQVLSTSTPGFLDSMRMKMFTLGTKPPRLEHVKTYPKADDDTVLMDWKFSFTPNDTADLTARQIKNKVNPKVVLEVRVGKAMISKGLDVIVEDMACSGIMRVKMKLQIPFPHMERVEICFLERPVFDYVCKPLGGDMLGLDMNLIPGLESFIKEMIHSILGPMMYAPNVFPIEIAKMLAGNPVDQAIGVLQVTFHGAQGLKNTDKFSGTPDPYATVSINNRDVLGKTKTVPENANPRWNETVNIILTSLKEPLTINVFDFNDYRKDKELGTCTFQLEKLETEHEHENQHLEVIANGRPRGIVQADIRFFPILEGHKLADGTVEPPPESSSGIAKFTVEQGKDLDGTRSLIGQLNPYAVLLLNGKEIQVSKKLKRTNNPIWDNASKELLITDRRKAKLGLVIKDDRDLAADPIVGSYQIKLDDLIDLTSKGQEWFNLAGVKTGRAKMTLQWKPVALKGSLGGSGGYVTPIGVLRFYLKSAKDLKNLETMGKSDPYARVLLSGIQKGRTVTFENNLNPEWDEVIYVPIHSTREKLTIEVMDEETLGKDRTLGQIEVAASEYVHQGEDGEYLISDTKDEMIANKLRLGRGDPKGILNYSVAFYPTLNVVDPDDEEEEPQKSADIPIPSIEGAAATGRGRSATAGTISTLKSTRSSVDAAGAEMRNALAQGEKEQTETDEVKVAPPPKVRITPEDLSRYESGLLVFKIIDGELSHQGCHLEVVIDDFLFPAWSSAKTKSRSHTFNETGDVMIRELDLSRITLRLVEEVDRKGDDKEEHVKAKLSGSTLDTLRKCLYQPTQLELKDRNNRVSKITVSLKFLPVKMQLHPSESFNNSGNLRVEVLDAADLPAADRNGKSDPYCKFHLNGKEVYKTKTQKKTLHPAWNEFFEVPIQSRTAAKFLVKVYDWDFGDKADLLGNADINLDVLEPFQAQEVTLGLDGASGALRLKMLFRPDYVTRSRQGSSTFSGTFSTPGKIVGAPVKGVGKGVTMVGGGVVKGAGFLGRGFKRRTTSQAARPSEDINGSIADIHDTSMEVPSSPPGTANGHASMDGYAGSTKELPRTPHQRQTSFGASSQAPAHDLGTATISVLSAAGFSDNKLQIRILHDSHRGLREVLKTDAIKTKTGEATWDNESAKISCSPENTFRVMVRDQHTFSSEDLGEASFFIDDQGTGGTKEIKVGTGVVVIRSSFQPSESSAPSLLAPDASPAGKQKLGRFMSRRERSVTPSGS